MFLDRRHAGQLAIPGNLHPGGFDDLNGGVHYGGTDAIAGDERNLMHGDFLKVKGGSASFELSNSLAENLT